MNAIAFDTLKLARGLEEAGFEHTQALKTAEILASTIGETVVTRDYLDVRLKELEVIIKELETSTRHDIKELEASTKRDIKELESALRHDFDTKLVTLEQRLTLRLGGMLVTGIVVVAALVKLL